MMLADHANDRKSRKFYWQITRMIASDNALVIMTVIHPSSFDVARVCTCAFEYRISTAGGRRPATGAKLIAKCVLPLPFPHQTT